MGCMDCAQFNYNSRFDPALVDLNQGLMSRFIQPEPVPPDSLEFGFISVQSL